MARWVGWLLALLLAGCAALPGTTVQQPSTLLPTPSTRGPAPEVSLPMLDGEPVTLAAWRGKGVILNFWATWCYPCRTEMPALAAIHERYQDEVVVVGVNFEEEEEEARAFVEELELPFPILLDQEAELARELRVQALPTTFFIDSEGQIVGSHLGPLTEAGLAEMVERLRAKE